MLRAIFFLIIVTPLLLGTSTAFAQVANISPPWLGVILAEESPEGAGVESVIRKSPAHRAGVEAGDRIIEINGETVNSSSKLQMLVRGQRSGQQLEIKIARGSSTVNLSLTLTPSPTVDDMLAGHHLGHPAPNFAFTTIGEDENTTNLASLHGKPTIIEFWATWCTPCRPVARDLTAIQRRHEGKVNIVGLSSEDKETLNTYVRQHVPTYVIAHDDREAAHKGFLVRSYPVAFLLDAEHQVVGVFTGTDLGPRLEKALTELLAGQEKENGAQGSESSE